MKKKNVFLSIAVLLLMGLPGHVDALSLTEQVQNIKEQAIALAKKGGAQSKKLWNKINLIGKADRERIAAETALNMCSLRYCKSQREILFRGHHKSGFHRISAQAALERCERVRCPKEFKRFKRAQTKVMSLAVGLALFVDAVIVGTAIGVATVYGECQHAKIKATE